MKALFICMTPIILVLWIVLCLAYGFLHGTLLMVISLILTAIMVWWVDFCCQHFNK